MLHNAILAVGTAFSDNPAVRDLRARMYFLEKAKSYLEEECSRPHLSVVQALSLVGSFHSSQGDRTLGYVVFGELYSLGVVWDVNDTLGFRHERSGWPST